MRVLLVEDHRLFRDCLSYMIGLSSELIVCGEADSMAAAITLACNRRPDIAIVNRTVSGASGLDLIEALKARSIHIPVLALSNEIEPVYARRALGAGASGCVAKSDSFSDLIGAVRKILAGEIYVSPQMAPVCQGVIDSAREIPEEEILTQRQLEVFQMLGCGRSTREIAAQLHLSGSTVGTFRIRIQEKLRLKNSAELYHRATKWVMSHEMKGEAPTAGPAVDRGLATPSRRSRHKRIVRRGVETGRPNLSLLTNRELEVFRLIGRGNSTREIAALLHLGGSTVSTYRARIKRKLRVDNRADLYYRATEWVAEQDGAANGTASGVG